MIKASLGLLALALLGAIFWIVLALVSWQERRPRRGLWALGVGVLALAGIGWAILARGAA